MTSVNLDIYLLPFNISKVTKQMHDKRSFKPCASLFKNAYKFFVLLFFVFTYVCLQSKSFGWLSEWLVDFWTQIKYFIRLRKKKEPMNINGNLENYLEENDHRF